MNGKGEGVWGLWVEESAYATSSINQWGELLKSLNDLIVIMIDVVYSSALLFLKALKFELNSSIRATLDQLVYEKPMLPNTEDREIWTSIHSTTKTVNKI